MRCTEEVICLLGDDHHTKPYNTSSYLHNTLATFPGHPQSLLYRPSRNPRLLLVLFFAVIFGEGIEREERKEGRKEGRKDW